MYETMAAQAGFPARRPLFRKVGADDSDALVGGALVAICGTAPRRAWTRRRRLGRRRSSSLADERAGQPS